MAMKRMNAARATLVVALAACGGGGNDPRDPDAPPSTIDADPSAPDAAPGDWRTLISASWTLAAGDEGYWCATKTMTEDVYAHVMRPLAPLGTHHTVINIVDGGGPDNPGFPCGPEFGAFWASGVNTPALELPEGVGLLAAQGRQLRMSLHLFNASDHEISGTSGLEVQELPASEVVHVASVSYHGPASFSIPANDTPYTQTHTTSLGARTLVGVFPHMHQLGTHFSARVLGGESEVVVWDEDYQFESQEFAPLPSIPVTPAETLETACTWRNDTGSPVGWGDSSEAEMCFTILMSY
jgi:hypothetical protein